MRASKFWAKHPALMDGNRRPVVEVDFECADEDHTLELGQYSLLSVKIDGVERLEDLTNEQEQAIHSELDEVFIELEAERKLEYAYA